MIPDSHPYWHVRNVLERNRNVISVPMSYYVYEPRRIEDFRDAWEVDIVDFLNVAHVTRLIQGTPSGRELAIHSNVQVDGSERLHLIMVDMSTGARAQLLKLRAFLSHDVFQKISWYASGRSFHGYGSELMSQADWYKFMGLLLLANQPHQNPTVDPRWIGHRLIAGYAALRWTKNTNRYITTPALVNV